MGRILWYNIGSGNHALRLSESVGQGGGGTLKKWRKSLLLFCALLTLLLLSACSPGRDMEEFMALPRLPQEYLELQKVLDALQSDGASVSPYSFTTLTETAPRKPSLFSAPPEKDR